MTDRVVFLEQRFEKNSEKVASDILNTEEQVDELKENVKGHKEADKM